MVCLFGVVCLGLYIVGVYELVVGLAVGCQDDSICTGDFSV